MRSGSSTPKIQKRKSSDPPPPVPHGAVVLKQWSELPSWQQEDNHHIQTSYRPASYSYIDSWLSWGYLHNESVNIFSHLIGAALFFALPKIVYGHLKARYETASRADVVVVGIYLLGVAVCFALSTTFHTIMNHSEPVFNWGISLDFQGILILMYSATIPIIYYGFVCNHTLRAIYWTLITVLAIGCSIFTFSPAFRKRSPYLKIVRAGLFGGFAMAAVVPIIHSIAIWGWAAQNHRISLSHIMGLMAFNTAGATAYAFRFPEKYFPRTFDIFGGSHQIMHIMVLCAALVHVLGLIRDFDNYHGRPLECT